VEFIPFGSDEADWEIDEWREGVCVFERWGDLFMSFVTSLKADWRSESVAKARSGETSGSDGEEVEGLETLGKVPAGIIEETGLVEVDELDEVDGPKDWDNDNADGTPAPPVRFSSSMSYRFEDIKAIEEAKLGMTGLELDWEAFVGVEE
jgi:hypothetical protein